MVLAVPAPPTRGAGTRITGAIYQADVTDSVTFLANVPVFQGYQSAAQSIGNGSLTALGLDTEEVDTYNGHDTVTNNSRYTPTVAGYYLVLGCYGYAANATGNRFAFVYKNGALVVRGQNGGPAPGAANTGVTQVAAVVYCNGSTDYVETYCYQSSGGALNTTNTQSGMTVYWAHA